MYLGDSPIYPSQPPTTPSFQLNSPQSLPHSRFEADALPYNYFNPVQERGCGNTVVYKTLPPTHNQTVFYSNQAKAPTSVKSLYTGVPNYYPNVREDKPVDTMYNNDYTLLGNRGQLLTSHFQAYPFHHYFVREYPQYSSYSLPVPSAQRYTSYPVVSEGHWGR